jgi:hypothetical protein
MIEIERSTELDQPHAFQSGKSVTVFSNGAGKPERDHMNGVINYVTGQYNGDHTEYGRITLNGSIAVFSE